MEQARVVIVGGGVVGCAIAAELAARTSDVFVLEQMPRVGMMTSTRNSGVIHSGIYYPPGSLKARHCVEGNRLTYEFCEAHDVPYKGTGKVVVATTPEEEAELHALRERGRQNGVEGLDRILVRPAHLDPLAGLESRSLSGEEQVERNIAPSLGGEDFSYMLLARPGAMMWIGNGPGEDGCTLHNSRYDFNDAALPIGASFFARLAERFLARQD